MRRLTALRERARDDAGFSLLELIVALGVFSLFIAVAITTFSTIGNSVVTARSRANSATGVLDVFQTMDRQVRYADSINFAGLGASGDAYVEFQVPAKATTTGVATCTQWRYVPSNGTVGVPGTIGYRRWNLGGTPPTGWQIKATDVDGAATGTYPFSLTPATAGVSTLQQLVLSVTAGNTLPGNTTLASVGFVARNSSLNSPSNFDSNGDGNSDTPVCFPAGVRP
jgi:prepilin-type N-terminal cleavage/methylation domain-containing protein